MSIFKALILPVIERNLAAAAPHVAELALKEMYSIATDIIDHVVSKQKEKPLRALEEEAKNV